jgi:hypothetical protein
MDCKGSFFPLKSVKMLKNLGEYPNYLRARALELQEYLKDYKFKLEMEEILIDPKKP